MADFDTSSNTRKSVFTCQQIGFSFLRSFSQLIIDLASPKHKFAPLFDLYCLRNKLRGTDFGVRALAKIGHLFELVDDARSSVSYCFGLAAVNALVKA